MNNPHKNHHNPKVEPPRAVIPEGNRYVAPRHSIRERPARRHAATSSTDATTQVTAQAGFSIPTIAVAQPSSDKKAKKPSEPRQRFDDVRPVNLATAQPSSKPKPVRRQAHRSQVLQRALTSKPALGTTEDLQVSKKQLKSDRLPIRAKLPSLRMVLGSGLAVVSFALFGSAAAFLFHNDPSSHRDVATQSAQTVSAPVADTDNPVLGYVSETKPSAASIKEYEVAAGLPRVLSIENVNIQARVQQVSVDQNNHVQLPDNVFDVGWYEGSRKPGENGVVLLNGYVSGPTERAALYYLRALEVGDEIELEAGDGTKHRYQVEQRSFVNYQDINYFDLLVPQERGVNALHIVAVDDRYNVMNNDFQDRLVIFATEVN